MFRTSLLPRTTTRLSPQIRQHQHRLMHTSPRILAAKTTQDKDSLDPQSNEYSKSGSDQAAASSSAAFDPSSTSPEAAERQAEREDGGNSLKVSPGNSEVSRARKDEEGGAQGSPRSGVSSKGAARKSGGGKSG